MKYFETYDTKKDAYLVMRYVDGVNLESKIEVNTLEREYGERTTATYMEQILKAVSHIHTHDIIHRDLNPRNIMITKDNDVRIIDFSQSANQNDKKVSKFAGELLYTAPEVFEGKTTVQSDMWTLGVVLYYVISGFLPFKEATQALTKEKIMKNEYEWKSPEFDNVSDECKDLISKLLTKNPKNRLTA